MLYATIGAALLVAALVGVIASAQPSSDVGGNTPLLGELGPGDLGPGLDGGHLSLAQFRHEWVLVNFMATWCPPCQAEMPQLQAFVTPTRQGGDATVLTVVYDPSNVSALRSYLAARKAGWPAGGRPGGDSALRRHGLADLVPGRAGWDRLRLRARRR